MLERLKEVKDGLRRMVLSEDWKKWVRSLNGSAKEEAEAVTAVIEDTNKFWTWVDECCTIMEPAFVMIRLLEHETQTVAEVYAAAAKVCTPSPTPSSIMLSSTLYA